MDGSMNGPRYGWTDTLHLVTFSRLHIEIVPERQEPGGREKVGRGQNAGIYETPPSRSSNTRQVGDRGDNREFFPGPRATGEFFGPLAWKKDGW